MAKREKPGVKVAAVIEIGTNAIRLKIGECGKKGIKIIEELYRPIGIGRETFALGKVSVEKIDKACEILKGFQSVILENGVDEVFAFSTSALYEASNKEYIQDKIKIKTGIYIHIIDAIDEKTAIYQEMTRMILAEKLKCDPALMVYIGSGNLGVALYQKGTLPFMQNFKTGSLRLSGMFEDIQDETESYPVLVEEYQSSITAYLKKVLPNEKIEYFIACGREILMIADLCGVRPNDHFLEIPKDVFLEHYDIIKEKTTTQLMEDYDLLEEKAELLFPAMSLYQALFNLTHAKSFVAPIVFLRDAFLFQMLYPEKYQKNNQLFEMNTIVSAKYISQRYLNDQNHVERVARYSLKLFDKMKKRHGLGKRDRLLLETAAILHDTGKFINIKSHEKNGAKIVLGSDIIGLNQQEIKIVANIVRYHSYSTPDIRHKNYKDLTKNQRVLVSKLAALLKIGEALEKSHYNKFEDIDVRIEEETLYVTVDTYKDIKIEQWAFDEKIGLFEDVYGMKAQLKRKRVI